MRPISDELRKAQAMPNVAWKVSARVRHAGSSVGERLESVSVGDEPGAVWLQLYYFNTAPYYVSGQPWRARSGVCWAAQPYFMLQAYRSDQAAKVGVCRKTVFEGTYGYAPVVDVSVIDAPYSADIVSRPVLARLGSTVRLVWADGAFLYWSESNDDGVTWSARQMLYNGTGSYIAHTNLSLAVTDGAWVLVYNSLTATGGRRLRGAHDAGDGWVNWSPHTTTVDWLVAGIAELTATRCIVYLSGRNFTWSSLAVGEIELNAGAFVAWWTDQPKIVDRAGLEGEIEYDGVTVGVANGTVYLIMREGLQGSKRYWTIAGLLGGAGSSLMEEPVFLTTFEVETFAEEETHLDMLATEDDIYLFGVGVVARLSIIRDPVPADSLIIKEYTYQQRIGQGGRLVLHCEWSGPEPKLKAGDWLELTRQATAAWAGDVIGGSDRRLFRIIDIVQQRSGIGRRSLKVVAVDALGILSEHRLRRQHVLRAGDRTVRQDLEAIAAWSGVWLDFERGAEFFDAAGKSAGFVCTPRLSNLTALQQYLLKWPHVLWCGRRDADDGTGDWGQFSVIVSYLDPDISYADPDDSTERPTVHLIEPEHAPGSYENIRHPVGAWEQHITIGDVLTVVLGMNQYGTLSEVWSVSSTGGYNSVRPKPDVRVSRAWDANQVGAVAWGEYVRNRPSDALVRVEMPAHVGIELWEFVMWREEEIPLRVIAIREQWKDGRLMMELELG